jgi:hypothetical protein
LNRRRRAEVEMAAYRRLGELKASEVLWFYLLRRHSFTDSL